MTYQFEIHNELYLKARGNGVFFAKKGSMVADSGNFKYAKRLLGTNGGNIAGQVLNHVARRMTGENLEVMEVKGEGEVYLADQGAHVLVIGLEPNGNFSSISVESEDLLGFTETCKYGVTPVGVGVLSQKGLFTSKLSYNGQGAQVAIKTNGNPLVLTVDAQNPVIRVDPDAVVAWTGKAPKPKLTANWKALIGQASGESYMFEFKEFGQTVIVQPFERESGLKVGIDDKSYTPETQNSSYQNTMGNFGGVQGQGQGGFGQGDANGGQPSQPGGIGGMIGNFLGR